MKRILVFLLVMLTLVSPVMAAQQTVNNGDTYLSVRTKINANFTETYNHLANQANPHGVTKAQAGLSYVENVKHAYAMAIAPTVTADSSIGYEAGKSLWLMTTGAVYLCTDASAGAAVWVSVGGGSGTTDHAELTNLDYASAGHTGFAPALGVDDNYVTDAEKAALHPIVDISGKQDVLVGSETIFDGWDKNATDDFDGAYTSLTAIPATFAPSSHNNSAHSETYLTAEVDGSITNEIELTADELAAVQGAALPSATNVLATITDLPFISVKAYGSDGDAVNSAIAAAVATGRKIVYLPSGTYTTDVTITLPSQIFLVGEGSGATVIKAANGLNDNVIESEGFDTLTGGGLWLVSAGVPHGLGLKSLSIDGNRANNTSGMGVAFYSKRLYVDDVVIYDTAGVGWYSEAGDVAGQQGWEDLPESQITSLWVRNAGSHGFQFRGPHDAHIKFLAVNECDGDGVRIERSVGVYSGSVDIGFMHIYANAGVGFYSNTSYRAAQIISESNYQEGFTHSGWFAQIGMLQLYTNGRTSGTYNATITGPSRMVAIQNLQIKDNGEDISGLLVDAGGVLINQMVVYGDDASGINSTGMGVTLTNNSSGAVISDASVSGWATGVSNNVGGSANGSQLNLRVYDCETLWDNNSGSEKGNVYNIVLEELSGTPQTQTAGTLPTVTNDNRGFILAIDDTGGSSTLFENNTILGTGAVDSISEISASLKSGADGTLVTGTAGTSGNCVEWNADGDIVDAGAACGTGGSSLWSEDTYGITYASPVGIGGASASGVPLRIAPASGNAKTQMVRPTNADQLLHQFVPAGTVSSTNHQWQFGVQPNVNKFSLTTWNGASTEYWLEIDPENNLVDLKTRDLKSVGGSLSDGTTPAEFTDIITAANSGYSSVITEGGSTTLSATNPHAVTYRTTTGTATVVLPDIASTAPTYVTIARIGTDTDATYTVTVNPDDSDELHYNVGGVGGTIAAAASNSLVLDNSPALVRGKEIRCRAYVAGNYWICND
jgi:hypothetical protein